MSKPCIVFVESNTSGTGRLFVRVAGENGYDPVMLVDKAERYPFLKEDSVPFRRCNTNSRAEIAAILQSLQRESALAGIFSSSEYFLETAALFAEQYRLPGPNPKALQTCRNKYNQRRALQLAGLLTPIFERATTPEEAHLALTNVPLPVVVKPTLGSGSVGVRLCYTKDEAVEHASCLLRRTTNERGMPVPSEVLIEEYLQGREYSVETFNGTALGITQKYVSSEPFFVELGHDFPTDLPPEVAQSVTKVALNGLQALGLGWGPGHVEMRVTAKGPAIVEINPRLAGGFIPEIVRLSCGVDMIRQTIRAVVGEHPELHAHGNAHASIRFLTPSRNGVITAMKGLGEAAKIPGVADIQTYRKIGDRVSIENDFRDRIGHVIACARTGLDAVRSSEMARSRIEIQIEPQ